MTNEENASYFAVIPAPVLFDERLTGDEKIFYALISALTNQKGFCFASDSYFAEKHKCTRRTIQNRLSKLSKYDHIRVTSDSFGANRKIWLTVANPKGGYETDFIGGYETNFTHNNKGINNKTYDIITSTNRRRFLSLFLDENKNQSQLLSEAEDICELTGKQTVCVALMGKKQEKPRKFEDLMELRQQFFDFIRFTDIRPNERNFRRFTYVNERHGMEFFQYVENEDDFEIACGEAYERK